MRPSDTIDPDPGASPSADYDVVPARDGYDRWAAIYDDEDNPLILLETPHVDACLGDVRGRDVLDVGCGTGRHAIRLAARGASVTAIDFSRAMLDRAARKPGAGSVRFLAHDLHTPLPFGDAAFDLALCALVGEHIDDLSALFAEIGRVLRPAGRAVISLMHPAMMLRGITARFVDPQTGRETRPQSRTHQLSDFVMAAVRANLRIESMSEHAVDAALAARSPRSQKYLGWPMLLMMVLRPAAPAGAGGR